MGQQHGRGGSYLTRLMIHNHSAPLNDIRRYPNREHGINSDQYFPLPANGVILGNRRHARCWHRADRQRHRINSVSCGPAVGGWVGGRSACKDARFEQFPRDQSRGLGFPKADGNMETIGNEIALSVAYE